MYCVCSGPLIGHLSSELSEHEKLIDKMVSADFTKYITEDLNRPLDDIQPLLEETAHEAREERELDPGFFNNVRATSCHEMVFMNAWRDGNEVAVRLLSGCW
ncbi:Vacuolar protein sorting-associated protein 54 [Portunus trituberculatus]|uniref:Vacuolar protein sorting-associated protein 54 n=1 Tax=Portunus trituberculatus TaxID=210409 RepID=A0A5B7HJ55_PORTR|nr:Vacuolar protein sorting-associated protein 54 [Portunus trituberculatus]